MVVKLGIIGPRTFSLDGHDFDSEKRVYIRGWIENEILSWQKKGYTVMGLTGLGLGVEQDFAISCLETRTDYIAYLPFQDQEERWSNLPNIIPIYNELLKRAIETHVVCDGSYSPKKIITKNERIASLSNKVLIVSDVYKSSIIDHIKAINTNIEVIDV